MSEPLVLRNNDNGVTVLTLNNPRLRNALSRDMLAELKRHFDEIGADRTVRVVVVKANGPVFSSGHNLNECVGKESEEYAELFALCTSVMEAIRLLPQPVIAEVAGLATAAGCQLVATCDLVVASEEAKFATPGVNIGLFCTTPGVAVARAVPPKQALELLLTGTPISAAEARRIGLVNRVVPADKLAAETMILARQIAQASARVVAIGKRAFYDQIQLPRTEAYAYAEQVMVDNLREPDAKEGIEAFLQKRPPVWKN